MARKRWAQGFTGRGKTPVWPFGGRPRLQPRQYKSRAITGASASGRSHPRHEGAFPQPVQPCYPDRRRAGPEANCGFRRFGRRFETYIRSRRLSRQLRRCAEEASGAVNKAWRPVLVCELQTAAVRQPDRGARGTDVEESKLMLAGKPEDMLIRGRRSRPGKANINRVFGDRVIRHDRFILRQDLRRIRAVEWWVEAKHRLEPSAQTGRSDCGIVVDGFSLRFGLGAKPGQELRSPARGGIRLKDHEVVAHGDTIARPHNPAQRVPCCGPGIIRGEKGAAL